MRPGIRLSSAFHFSDAKAALGTRVRLDEAFSRRSSGGDPHSLNPSAGLICFRLYDPFCELPASIPMNKILLLAAGLSAFGVILIVVAACRTSRAGYETASTLPGPPASSAATK